MAIARGRVLGVVPKTFLPNYREYYEKRWFASGAGLTGLEIDVAGQTAPFGTDLIFAASDLPHFIFHAEICEDFWAPTPPSTTGALAGALVLLQPLRLEHRHRQGARARDAVRVAERRGRCAAYVFSAAGPGESTTDLAWDGQGMIHELGELLAESDALRQRPEIVLSPMSISGGCGRSGCAIGTFNDAAAAAGHPETRFRRIAFEHQPDFADIGLKRATPPLPVRAQHAGTARRGLLRGVQHPGRGRCASASPRPGASGW